jgi:hypothetical protein
VKRREQKLQLPEFVLYLHDNLSCTDMDTISGTIQVQVWDTHFFYKTYVDHNGYRISGAIGYGYGYVGQNEVPVQPR